MDPTVTETPVSIDATSPVVQPVSIDTQAEGNPTPSAAVADKRANKASFGLGDLLGLSKPEIYTRLMQGQEQQIRDEASSKINMINDQARVQKVIDLVNKQGKTLTLDQMEALRQPPSDPNAVFEDNYAEKFVQGMFRADANIGGTDLTDAMAVAPGVVNSDMKKGQDDISNYEYAQRKNDDVKQLYESQAWLPWVGDQLKGLIPFYNTVRLHAWLKDQGGLANWLPGENLYEQTRELLRLPGPQFRQKLDEVTERLKDDPTLALQYTNAILGMSTRDVGMGNLGGAMDVASIPGVGALGRGLKSLVAVRNGIKDGTIAARAAGESTEAAIAEGFGDTGTAAANRAADTVVKDIRGEPTNPIQRAKQALPTGLNVDTDNIAQNPSPLLSRELHNRIIQDQRVASKSIVDVIENTAKVQRIDLEEAAKLHMTEIKNEVAQQQGGLRNAIADIGDPVWNPFSNTHDYPIKLFDWTGEQFATEAQAKRFSKQEGVPLDAEITGKPFNKVYVPGDIFWKVDAETGEKIPSRTAVAIKDGEVKVTTYQPEVKLNKAGKPIGYSKKNFVEGDVQTTTKPLPGYVGIDTRTGKVDAKLLTDMEAKQAVIDQQGLGYHITYWKGLNENQHFLKDLVKDIDTGKSIASSSHFGTWMNAFPIIGDVKAGDLVSSDLTLSKFDTMNRKTATYSVSNYQKLLQNEVKYIEDVARGRVRVDPVTGEDISDTSSYTKTLSPVKSYQAKQQWGEFKRALEAAPGMTDESTGRIGYLMSNPNEINEFWWTNFQHAPSFEQIRGYLAFKRLYEMDRVFRSVREYTNKARLGAEQHQITVIDRAGNRHQSGFFDAVPLKSLPGGDYPILIADGADTRVKLTSKLGSDWQRLNEMVQKGEGVISEIFMPEARPLKTIPSVGNNYVRYVFVKASHRESKSLSWEQVNRLSGGHFEYDYSHAVKEADVLETRAGNTTIHSYERDKTFMFVGGHAQGQEVVNVLNATKKALREGDVALARDIFENGLKGEQGPAMKWDDFYNKTKTTTGPGGITLPPVINIKEPFHVVPKGRTIIDIDGDAMERRYGGFNDRNVWQTTLQDRTKSGSLAQQYKVGYTQERDAENMMELRNIGSKANPIYKHEPAKMVDPIVTMNRALNQIVSSSVMDDMRIASVEGWLREAEPWLKSSGGLNEIRSSPWRFFNNADSAEAFKPGADPTMVANLISNRFKIKQFLGIPSKYDLFMHDASQKIADWTYDKMGPKSESSLVPTWLLTKTTSPVSMLRAFAYHSKMGLFALPQVLTQSQTFLTIGAIAPRSAPSGTFATTLTRWGKYGEINPSFLDKLDSYASKFRMPGTHGFKPGEFKEAYTEMTNRGFANVGGEYATLDTQLGHKYFQGVGGDVLDAGQIFFKWTEQNVRMGAWYTAYLEYKAMNKIAGKLTRSDWDKVLARADDMTGNMSRASASILQSGPLSLTSQFLTYPQRAAELFWSPRLTKMEKARMLAMYGTVFGAGGIGITGLPLNDLIRRAAFNNGYVVGDNYLQSTIMEGVPAASLAWLTSDTGDAKDGNWYNINDKFGVGGLTQYGDLFKSDAKWYTFLGGAASSIAANTWANSAGLRHSSWDWMQATMSGKDPVFAPKWDDVIDLAKEITSVNQAWKGYTALWTGRWLSKNEAYQADVSKGNAIFMAATGLNLQNAADNYAIGEEIKDQQEKQKYALNNFIKEYRRGIQAAINDDYPSYQQYMTRAYQYLDWSNYPVEEYGKAQAIAGKGWESRINSIRQEFYTKNVPAGTETEKFDAYQRFLRTQRP